EFRMSESEPETPDEREEPEAASPPPRKFFTRRNGMITAGIAGIVLVLLALFGTVGYRYGVFDTYIRNQFVAKMHSIGIDFSADVFRVTVNPLELELRNATFNDRLT